MAKPSGNILKDMTPLQSDRLKATKKNLGLSKPKADTSAQDAIAEQQKLAQAELDAEENRKRKQMLSSATGIRAYRGSPLFRAAPANTAGRAATAAATSGGPSTAVSGGGGASRGFARASRA